MTPSAWSRFLLDNFFQVLCTLKCLKWAQLHHFGRSSWHNYRVENRPDLPVAVLRSHPWFGMSLFQFSYAQTQTRAGSVEWWLCRGRGPVQTHQAHVVPSRRSSMKSASFAPLAHWMRKFSQVHSATRFGLSQLCRLSCAQFWLIVCANNSSWQIWRARVPFGRCSGWIGHQHRLEHFTVSSAHGCLSFAACFPPNWIEKEVALAPFFRSTKVLSSRIALSSALRSHHHHRRRLDRHWVAIENQRGSTSKIHPVDARLDHLHRQGGGQKTP